VITLSDRAFAGTYEDTSGIYICDALKLHGSEVVAYQVLPDDEKQLQDKIFTMIDQYKPTLILTTGGTGIGPRDITPEAIMAIADKTLPGIGELLRAYGSQYTPYSWISRTLAAVVKNTLVICLPGSERAVKEGVSCLMPILSHLIKMLHGK
jgi:molybdenum cofactor synthesis domain-containing protein